MIHHIALLVEEFEAEITLEDLVVSASLRTFLKGPRVELLTRIVDNDC